MKVSPLNSLSVATWNKRVLCLLRDDNAITLATIDPNLEVVDRIGKYKGEKGFILGSVNGGFLISIDEKLIYVDDVTNKVVLRARPGNIFWHATRVENRVFVQEYGEAPTRIFVSEDLENWREVVTNIDLDKRSKHFHSIKYDPFRKWLIATLGDGCLTRVVYSKDFGETWRPMYKGPWQFLPIEILEDRIVFGMDSGIAKGGVAIYYPDVDRWDFIFLRWRNRGISFAQMCDLRLLDNGIWIATLGSPQAVVISEDLRAWQAVHIESFDKEFNPYMAICELEDFVICSIAGRKLLIIKKNELKKFTKSQPALVEYDARIDRLKGYGFTLRRKLPF